MKQMFLFSLVAASCVVSLSAQTLVDYQNTINGQSPSYYFTFDNTLVDSVGGSLTLTAAGGAFATDYFGNANKTRSLGGSTDSLSTTTDILAGGGPTGGNAAATGVGSVSFLFRTLDSVSLGGQRFVYAQGNTTGNANSFSLFFENASNTDPGGLKVRVGNGPTTTLMTSNLVAVQTWYYFAVTYDETRDAGEVNWYLGAAGGALNSGTINIGNTSVAGDNGTFTMGNSAVGATGAFRNPGSGQLDEFAFWNRELSSPEVNGQFTSLVPEPSLGAMLAVSGCVWYGTRRRARQGKI